MEEYVNAGISDGVPSLIALATRETVLSGLDDGRFGVLYVRDQVGNSNYIAGSEFDGTTYPDPGGTQTYRYTPLWYESGQGGITRGVSEYQRRLFFPGARRFIKSGRWWYVPSLLGTPSRWLPAQESGGASYLFPAGPFPPLDAGTITRGDQIENNLAPYYPDADNADGNWTKSTGGATDLYTVINEAAGEDTGDFMTTPDDNTDTTCSFTCEDFVGVPQADESVVLRAYVRASDGASTSVLFEVVEDLGGGGEHVVASMNATPLAAGDFQQWALTLTPVQIASVTDWSDLFFRVTKNTPGIITGSAQVSSLRLEYIGAGTATDGGWRGSDRFVYAVAYRFEDDSVWMPSTPRTPNDLLPDGFNMFTVDPDNPTAAYESVNWSNLPIPPHGIKSKLLLRGTKIDSRIESTLQIVPTDLRVVAEVGRDVTDYQDFFADDDALALDATKLLVRLDHIMMPRARYIFAGDDRVGVSYGGQNPVAITLAPLGVAADYDLNLPDSADALYDSPASYYRITATAGGAASALVLVNDDGTPTTLTLSFATYDTLQKLVDKINSTTFSVDGMQWRAQLGPNVDGEAPTSSLTPTVRTFTSCTISGDAISRAGGGLLAVPNGAFITSSGGGAGSGAGAYQRRINSDTSVNFTGTLTAGGPFTITFAAGTGDSITGGTDYDGYIRVIGQCLPGFLYFTKDYLDEDPIKKSRVWLTVATPGATRAAANAWSGKIANRHEPPETAGISMGGFAVDNGFVVPFSRKNMAIGNRPGEGFDSEYKLYALNESRGCCAWQSVTAHSRCGLLFSPEGLVACDLEREVLLTDAIYRHSDSDAKTGVGDFAGTVADLVAATAVDDDSADLYVRVMRGAVYVNYDSGEEDEM